MTELYRMANHASAAFMSRTSFISWFFSWAGRMDIDFRKIIDPWCGYNPKMLAGDGTHVGVSLRNLHINPIEKPADDAPTKESLHRRYGRVFMPYRDGIDNAKVRNARSHLLHLAKQALSEDGFQSVFDDTAANTKLLECLPVNSSVNTVVNNFICRLYPVAVHQCLASVLKMLATDAPVIALLPFRYLHEIERAIDVFRCRDSNQQGTELSRLRHCCPELAGLLKQALSSQVVLIEICDFIQYLVTFVRAENILNSNHR
jgi:hypothetical protein